MMSELKFDWTFVKAEAIGKEHGIEDSEVEEWQNSFEKVHDRITDERRNGKLGFWQVIETSSALSEVLKVREYFAKRDLANVVVFGIGGSALGAKASFQALRSPFHNLQAKPRLFIADNIDPEEFGALLDLLDLERTLFVVISKSGTTAETVSQFLVAYDLIVKQFGTGRLKEFFVVITDPEKGILRQFSKRADILTCTVPPRLGGRFSVLSPVGLLPLSFLGVDVGQLVEGAKFMAEKCKSGDIDANPAYKNGLYHVIADRKKGKKIHVYWAYAQGLYGFSDWLRQLIAESLGKSRNGDAVGPTPVKALGVTDQHSQLQLYREGPNDKIITILGVEHWRRDVTINTDADMEDLSYLQGHTLGELFHAEQKATACALAEASRPNITLWFPRLDEFTLGQAFFLYELQTVFMGYLYGINPFDQPGVELSKRMTYGLMGRPGFEDFANIAKGFSKKLANV
ncbi:MAG: glucose-6-phosphate isomerase [Deltaproteobacteria bacterium]|nr:glucose-6-phosphate isomerase [Deltaproteobacteria bacterium]MBW2068080.1 glucose-6-phosphate isomerase [Deltaproteobacteria bacterium]